MRFLRYTPPSVPRTRLPSSLPVPIGLLAGLAFSTALGLGVAEAVPTPMPNDVLPLERVQPGMKGYGLTVMSGTTPEKFDVEIISVLKGFRPNQDLILIKTPNHPRLDVAHTVAGMSGSPIYLEGKMIGAYAYGWTFGAEPIAGVTPIHNMIEDLRKPIPPLFKAKATLLPSASAGAAPARPRQLSSRAFGGLFDGESTAFAYDVEGHAKQLGARAAKERGSLSASSLAPASTPLLFGGMSPSAIATVEPWLRPMGLVPVQAGGGGGRTGAPPPGGPTGFVDGGAIGVQLVAGDISVMGLGTVTRVEGDKLVAFGHPMMGGGASDMPTALAKVHWILASTNRSFKIGEPISPMGTLVNDRQASIVVDTKRQATTFPVQVRIDGVDGAPKTVWKSVAAHDPFMAPMLASMAIGNALEATTAERGDMTWRATSKVKVQGYGELEFRDFGAGAGDPISADSFVRSRMTRALGALLNNPWEEARIESVETVVKVSFAREVAMIRGSRPVQAEIDVGQPARIEVELVPYQGKAERRTIEVRLPEGLADEDVEIELAPGHEIERPRPAPESLSDLVAALRTPTFPEESIVATVRLKGQGAAAYRGQIATRLPPGAIDTLRSSTSSVAPETFAAVDQTSHPVQRFVVGRDRVRVKVRPVLK